MMLSWSYLRGFRDYRPRRIYCNPYLLCSYDYNEYERGWFQAHKRTGLFS